MNKTLRVILIALLAVVIVGSVAAGSNVLRASEESDADYTPPAAENTGTSAVQVVEVAPAPAPAVEADPASEAPAAPAENAAPAPEAPAAPTENAAPAEEATPTENAAPTEEATPAEEGEAENAEEDAEPAEEAEEEEKEKKEAPVRSVTVVSNFDGKDAVYTGDKITLTAILKGFEGVSVHLQWQYYAGGWVNIPGATGTTYTFTASEETLSRSYRVWVDYSA